MVPNPSEQRSSATVRTKAQEALISQTCNNAFKGKKGGTDQSDLSLNRWLDDAAIQQGANKVSCQVTVVVEVTGIDVSSTVNIDIAAEGLGQLSYVDLLTMALPISVVLGQVSIWHISPGYGGRAEDWVAIASKGLSQLSYVHLLTWLFQCWCDTSLKVTTVVLWTGFVT